VIADILENILIMVLTIVALLGGFYLLLLLLSVWLKIKTGSREKEGLSNLWVATMKETKKSDHSVEDPAEK
jgi:hypothetical protein